MLWRSCATLLLLAPLALVPSISAAGGGSPDRDDSGVTLSRDAAANRSPVALANRCFAIASSADGRVVSHAGPRAYRARSRRGARPAAFYLKPTGIGTYLLYDEGGQLMGVQGATVGRVGGAEAAGKAAEWSVALVAARAFAITSTADGRMLAVAGRAGGLVLRGGRVAAAGERFAFLPARGCSRFPEAELGAAGRSFAGTNRDGTVKGFADVHLHITADMRAGGRVIHGEPFDRFGIPRALGGDAHDHGADGSLDVTGNLLRDGIPFGTHSTQGWPTFAGWPVHDTNTHQQVYWVWLERAWKAGLRLVVAQTVEDDELCRIEPLRARSCDETRRIALQVRRLRALQRYVDAQNGGRGRGWFRLVYGPRQARRVIERGKLAVVIGVESSNPFGCGYRGGRARCSRADVDRGIDRFRRLGIRSLFVAHWFDNAFAGAAIEGGLKGVFINALNKLRTGHYFATARCPAPGLGEEVRAPTHGEVNVVAPFFPAVRPLLESPVPTYPPEPRCNARGLTRIGGYLVRRLMAEHMLIEADHLSERARDRVLAIARARHYPLISSHTGTGGTWTPAQLRRLYALGGLASARPGTAPEMVKKILGQRRYRSHRYDFGVGLGTDTGGFSSLPGPRQDAGRNPFRYPFKSYQCHLTFRRERTGTKTYDLNADGVAHYGLFADLIGDMRRQKGGDRALAMLFRSAEAYLQMWRRSGARG